jgi:hypothetical protein
MRSRLALRLAGARCLKSSKKLGSFCKTALSKYIIISLEALILQLRQAGDFAKIASACPGSQ